MHVDLAAAAEAFNQECKECDQSTDDVRFGFKSNTLKSASKDKPYPCYSCGGYLGKYQGKTCQHLKCIHPLINKRTTNLLQFHDYCLLSVNYNSVSLCPCCVCLFSRLQFVFESGAHFGEYDADDIRARPQGHFKVNGIEWVFFVADISPDRGEKYFLQRKVDMLMAYGINRTLSRAFSAWWRAFRKVQPFICLWSVFELCLNCV